MERTRTAHQAKIPSPLAYVMRTVDERIEERCRYSFEMLTKLVLMAIGAGAQNILAASHWLHDHQRALFALGFRDRHGHCQLPSQATLYRFFWMLEAHIDELERALQHWAMDVLEALRQPGEPVRVGLDGKQLRGSKRRRQGEGAVQLLSCFVHGLGLTLRQLQVQGDEATAGRRLVDQLAGLDGLPWVFTGDAAFAERPIVEAVLKKRGMYLVDLKDNLAEIKGYAEWAFSLARCEQDSFFESDEVRSGELWLRELETRPATPEVTNDFPAARQFVRCRRTVVCKETGELRQETEYALTSSPASACRLAAIWRGHWEIENRNHHKRDTIWREDACRTRKGAQAFAALRNLMLSLFHLNGPEQVLRQVRRCNAQPQRLLSLLGVG